MARSRVLTRPRDLISAKSRDGHTWGMWVYERYKSGLTGFIYAPDAENVNVKGMGSMPWALRES